MHWLIFLFLSCSLALPSLAQKNDRRRFRSDVFNSSRLIDAKVGNSLWKFGSFYVTPVLGMRQLGYDDNVFSQEMLPADDLSAAPDFGFQTYLRLNANWIWANRATYTYLYYRELEDLRGPQYNAETKLHGIFKRVYFDMGANYAKNRQRIDSEIDDRLDSTRINAELNAIIELAPRANLILGSRLSQLEFDEPSRFPMERVNNLNRDELNLRLGFLYKLRPQFWPFAEISRSSFDFDLPGNPRDDSEFLSMALGVRNEFNRRLHFNIKGGLDRLRFDESPSADDDVASGEALLEYRITRLYSLEIGAQRYPVFSLISGYNFYLSARAFAGFYYKTRKGFRIGPEVEVGENDYQNPLVAVAIQRNDKIRSYSFSSEIPFRKDLSWTLVAGYLDRESNIEGQSDHGFQLFSDITLRFP